MESKPVWLTIILGFLLVTALAMYQYFAPSKRHIKRPAHAIVIGIEDDPLSGLVIIAHEAHYFRQAGVVVALKRYPTGHAAINAMLYGRVQLATASSVPILQHYIASRDVKILATISRADNQFKVVARAGRHIKAPVDLVGRRIATEPDSAAAYYTARFLKHYHIKSSDVQLIDMPTLRAVDAFRGGYIDAFVMQSPFVEEAKALMPGQTVEFQVPKLYRMHFNLVTTSRLLNQSPDQIHRILSALLKADQFIQANPQQAKADLVKFFGAQRRDEIIEHWGQYSYRLDLNQQLFNHLRSILRWISPANNRRLTDRSIAKDMKRVVTKRPLHAVQPGRVSTP